MRRLARYIQVPILSAGILLAGGKSAALSLSKGVVLSLSKGVALSFTPSGAEGPAPSGVEGLSKGAARTEPPVRIQTFRGMCDASGASFLDPDHFIVGNDEDNVLRIYQKDSPDPVKTVPLDGFVGLNPGEKNPETDIEASGRIGDTIYWICSHGRNTEGKIRSNRQRFFALQAGPAGIRPVGRPYRNLVADLLGDPKLRGLGLEEAAMPRVKSDPNLAPKNRGLNIEGLSRMPGTGRLLIGFRNPVPGGRALLVPLSNPEAVIFKGEKAAFGDPVLLDLGGLSIRSIEFVEPLGAYVIIAGLPGGGNACRLFTWSGRGRDRAVPFLEDADWMARENFTPEAFVCFPDSGELLLISDDGTLQLRPDGAAAPCPCKRLPDPDDRRFRGAWIPLNQR